MDETEDSHSKSGKQSQKEKEILFLLYVEVRFESLDTCISLEILGEIRKLVKCTGSAPRGGELEHGGISVLYILRPSLRHH
jgi:hypothetical protein